MNRSVFEGRFLVSMLGSMIRQDEKFPVHRRMNWERLFRISDYHSIASAIYLAMLGNAERVPEMWGERFFLRYQEAVRYGEGYEAAETEVLQIFQTMKLSVTVLESSAIRRLYPIPETAGNSPLRIYVPEESYSLAKGYLLDMGYETDLFYRGFGEHMRRSSGGFAIEIYRKLPFLTKGYQKNMRALLDRAYPDKNMNYIRTLSLESSFVFRLAETTYRYDMDELRIRELLDVYLFYKLFHKNMNRKFIDARLREFGISVTSMSLLHIADMWFGTRKAPLFPAPKEDMGIYDGIESRILSNGSGGEDSIPESQKLRKEIYDAINKEERAEKLRKAKAKLMSHFQGILKTWKFLFPNREYMTAIYPELEKQPALLFICWIRRLFHLLKIELKVALDRKPEKPEIETESEQESGSSLGVGADGTQFSFSSNSYSNSYGQRKRKKVFYKPHDHSGEEAAKPAEKQLPDSEGFREPEEVERSAAEEGTPVFGFEKLGEPLDIKEDPNFNTMEISEEEADQDEDEEQELLLWEFPKLSAVQPLSASEKKERENNVVFREHRELENQSEEDERLLVSDEVPRIKFTSYQAVTSSVEGMDRQRKAAAEPEQQEEKETGTVDGREVEFSKWKFPKIEDVES